MAQVSCCFGVLARPSRGWSRVFYGVDSRRKRVHVCACPCVRCAQSPALATLFLRGLPLLLGRDDLAQPQAPTAANLARAKDLPPMP